MTKLSRDEVLKLAQLARISLSEEEITEFSDELSRILGYVKRLSSADVSGLEGTNQVTDLHNVMREDKLIDYGYEPAVLLDNAAKTQDGQLKVNRMID